MIACLEGKVGFEREGWREATFGFLPPESLVVNHIGPPLY